LVNSIIPYPVRSYFNLVTKNAVFMRAVAFRKRLIRMYKKRGLFFGRQLKRTCTILAPVEQNIICFTGAFFN
ncbi:hypothetical protein, partial [Roseburia faecis]|uniref:hypothetical protein n=1 Tax=Roseburia faecis TaxID=301302 RepID=UPI001A9B80F6